MTRNGRILPYSQILTQTMKVLIKTKMLKLKIEIIFVQKFLFTKCSFRAIYTNKRHT